MPAVSVIIPTYQRAHLVSEAIDSVLAQTYTNYEIIVVDDGSSDNTRQVLSAYGELIRTIHQPNQGLPAARNSGICRARGQFIAFLDDDDLWLPHKLEKQVPLLDSQPDAGLIFSDVQFMDEHGISKKTYHQRFRPFLVIEPRTLFISNFIPVPSVIIRRQCLETVGLFDESLQAAEDYDMWLRILENWRAILIKERLAVYRATPGSMQSDKERLLLNVIRVKEKAYTRSEAIRHMPQKLLDRCFFDLYLQLERYYRESNQKEKAQTAKKRYNQVRGESAKKDE